MLTATTAARGVTPHDWLCSCKFPKPAPYGSVTRLGNGVTYFANLTQGTDPQVARLTTMGNIQALSGLKAISGPGGLIFVNAAAGQLGSLGQGVRTGPGTFRLGVNLIKRVRIIERISVQSGA